MRGRDAGGARTESRFAPRTARARAPGAPSRCRRPSPRTRYSRRSARGARRGAPPRAARARRRGAARPAGGRGRTVETSSGASPLSDDEMREGLVEGCSDFQNKLYRVSAAAPRTRRTNPSVTTTADSEIDSCCSSASAQRTFRLIENANHPSPCGRAAPRLPTKKPDRRRIEPAMYHATETERATLALPSRPNGSASNAEPPANASRRSEKRRAAARYIAPRSGAADLVFGHRPALERVVALRDVVCRAAAVDQQRLLDIAMTLDEAR